MKILGKTVDSSKDVFYVESGIFTASIGKNGIHRWEVEDSGLDYSWTLFLGRSSKKTTLANGSSNTIEEAVESLNAKAREILDEIDDIRAE